jgi:hypothetical protein
MVGGSLRVLRLLPRTQTGRHDIAEILLKVALKHKNSSILSVPADGYSRVICTKFDTYVFISAL